MPGESRARARIKPSEERVRNSAPPHRVERTSVLRRAHLTATDESFPPTTHTPTRPRPSFLLRGDVRGTGWRRVEGPPACVLSAEYVSHESPGPRPE